MGVPVICTRCGGTDGLIDDSNGQYIPTDDIEAMIKAMEYAYNNQNHYNRIMIRENCLKKYSPKAIANQLSNIYNKVIQNTNK
jgi:glycosyltransferase involved in cell wall biosynthesis